MNFNGFLNDSRLQVDQALKRYLYQDHAITNLYPKLHDAICYSIFNGGKRLRAALVHSSCYALTSRFKQVDCAACVVELIHSYSLIHDDLPAMDDDDFRRGQLSCHKMFGEAQAILAGDALQAYAIELLTAQRIDPKLCLKMINILVKADGYMVVGQAMDMDLQPDLLTPQQLEDIYAYKTAALINASLQLGALSSGCEITDSQTAKLNDYAQAIGIAFQIKDDILEIDDLESNDEKPDYVSLVGLQKAQSRVNNLYSEAIDAIDGFSDDTRLLKNMAEYMVKRSN